MNKNRQIFKDIHVEFFVTGKMCVGFWRCLRHEAFAPARTSKNTQNLWCECVCVCLHTCSIRMSHGGVTCYCMWQHSCAVLTRRGGLWDRSVFETAAGAVSPLCSLCLSLHLSVFLAPVSFSQSSAVHASLVSLKIPVSPPTCNTNSHSYREIIGLT